MKILIATGSFGGPATYSKLLAEKLPNFGYKVKVVSFGKKIVGYPWKFFVSGMYFFKLFFKSFGVDVIYAQDPVTVGFQSVLVSFMLRKRLFLKIVGDYAWEQSQQRFGVTDLLDEFIKKNNYPWQVRFFKGLETFVAHRAEKIIVPSEYLKGIVSAWGIEQNKIHVVYNAFVKPQLSETREDIRTDLNFKFPTIISVGRLVPWKNFPIVIDAFSVILKKYANAKLFIIDDGPDKKSLQERVSKLGIEENIIFLGRIPQEQVYKYIKGADVFTLISSYEGFSHLILETLALGTPIVTTPAGGNKEVIVSGKNGLLVPIGNMEETAKALDKLITDSALATTLSKEGLISVGIFTEENMLQNLSSVLR